MEWSNCPFSEIVTYIVNERVIFFLRSSKLKVEHVPLCKQSICKNSIHLYIFEWILVFPSVSNATRHQLIAYQLDLVGVCFVTNQQQFLLQLKVFYNLHLCVTAFFLSSSIYSHTQVLFFMIKFVQVVGSQKPLCSTTCLQFFELSLIEKRYPFDKSKNSRVLCERSIQRLTITEAYAC